MICHKYGYLEGGCDKILMLMNGVTFMRHVRIQWVGGKMCIANLFRYILEWWKKQIWPDGSKKTYTLSWTSRIGKSMEGKGRKLKDVEWSALLFPAYRLRSHCQLLCYVVVFFDIIADVFSSWELKYLNSRLHFLSTTLL